MCLRVSHKKKIWKQLNCFASLKSSKKGVGSRAGSGFGAGSGSISQRWGSVFAPKYVHIKKKFGSRTLHASKKAHKNGTIPDWVEGMKKSPWLSRPEDVSKGQQRRQQRRHRMSPSRKQWRQLKRRRMSPPCPSHLGENCQMSGQALLLKNKNHQIFINFNVKMLTSSSLDNPQRHNVETSLTSDNFYVV